MPIGIVVVGWNDRIGTVLKGKYPEDVQLSPDLAMKIYGSHVLGEEREAGFISMKVGDLNIASYFGGVEVNHYVAVLLTSEEEAADYEDALTRAALEIFDKLEGDKFKEDLPVLYRRVVSCPLFTEEQRVAAIYAEEKTRAALQYLADVGSASKEELADAIRDMLDIKTVTINAVLTPLIKAGIVSTEWVEGIPTECVFMVRDAAIALLPPSELMRQALEGILPRSNRYLKAVRRLFAETPPLPPLERQVELAHLMVDADAYRVLTELRKGPATEPELSQATGVAPLTVSQLVKRLQRLRLAIQDKEGRVFLLADPRVVTSFPEHLITTTIKRYNNEEIQPRQAARHLVLLREQFKTYAVPATVAA